MSRLVLEDYKELIGSIYEAGLDATKWRSFVQQLDAKLDCAALSLYGHDLKSNMSLGIIATRYSDDYLSSYQDHYNQKNRFLPLLLNKPVMRFERSEIWVPKEELVRWEFYNDWLRPQEDRGTGGGGVLFNEDDRLLIISGQVRFKDEEDGTPDLIEALRVLGPHIRKAFEIQRLLDGNRLPGSLFLDVLNQIGNAVFLLDRQGRITHANEAAETFLEHRSALMVDSLGVLRARYRDANNRIQTTLRRLAAGSFKGIGDPVVLRELDGERHVASLTPIGAQAGEVPFLAEFVRARWPVAMLIVVTPNEHERTAAEAMRLLYGLTPAECALADALLAGDRVGTYADNREISIETARNQLKSIFNKTGVSRQTELQSLMWQLSKGR